MRAMITREAPSKKNAPFKRLDFFVWLPGSARNTGQHPSIRRQSLLTETACHTINGQRRLSLLLLLAVSLNNHNAGPNVRTPLLKKMISWYHGHSTCMTSAGALLRTSTVADACTSAIGH